MSQQTPKKRVLFVRSLWLALLVFFGVFSLLLITLHTPRLAAAATSNSLNFQARLEMATGSIAPDGNYNVQFKLYSASSGGTALWTETYQNSATQGIRVTNGYLTANLGSITAFPTTINWDQQLWITMNIGGTTTGASPTYDGEMSPRLQLTAVPYAFKAAQLAQYNSTTGFTSSLQLLQPTGGNQLFQIPDQGAAGTFNLLTTSSGIQNQTASPQTAGFNINGTGTAGTFNATSALQTAGVTRVDSSGNLTNIGNISGSGNLQLSGTTGSSYIMSALGLGTSNPQAGSVLTIANSSWISSIDSTGTGYVNLFQVNSNNQIQVGAALNVDGGIVLPTNGGQLTFSDLPIDTSATAGTAESYSFRVGSSNVLTVYGEADGSGNLQNGRVAIGSNIAPAYTLDVGGDINTTGIYRQNGTAGSTTSCSGGFVLQNQIVQGGITTGGTCVANGGGVAPTLQNVYDNSGTANPQIQETTSSGGFKIRDASTTVGNILQIQNSTGASTYFSVSSTATTAGTFNATAALQTAGVTRIDASGNFSGGSINGDTLNSTALTFSGSSPTISASTTNSGLSINANGTGTLSLDTSGAGIINLGTNAATITLGAGTAAETVNLGNSSGNDTINIGIGSGTDIINIGNSGDTINVGSNIAAGANNFTTTGTLSGGTINASTILQTGGTQRIDASGNLSNIGTIKTTGSLATSANNVTTYQNVYSWGTSTATQTGTLEVILPNSWNNSMSSFHISGYDFSGAASWRTTIAGYNYSTGPTWMNTSADVSSGAPFTSVRLAYDSSLSKNVLLLGTTTTTWNYPQFSIDEVVVGYSNQAAWGSGYSSAFLTSETNITNVNTPPVSTTAVTSNTFLQGGNSFGATAVLGTNDNNSVQVRTNGVTRFTIDTSGNGTLTGALSAAGVTSTGGATVSGGAVSLTGNAASSLTTSAGGLNLDTTAAGQTTTIDNSAVAHTLQIATGAAVQGITVGSTNSTSSLLLQAGTGNLQLQTQGGTLGIGNNAAAQTLTIGNTTGATAVTIQSGTGALNLQSQGTGGINIGTNGVAQIVQIGNTTGASGVKQYVGTGNYLLDGVAASTYTIGASTTTGTVTIGGTAQTGNIVLGSSSGTNTVSIANGAGSSTVNIANVTTTGGVNIATALTSGSITIGNIGNTSTVINGGTTATFTSGAAGTTNVGTTVTTGTLNIGTGVTTGTTNLDTTAAGAGTLNIATGATQTTAFNSGTGAGAQTYQIANGAGAKTVTLGSTNTTSTTTIQGGSGNINLLTNSAGSGVIVKSGTNSAYAFQIQNSSGVPVFLVDTATSLSNNYVTYGGFEVGTTTPTGWVAAGSPTTFSRNTSAPNHYGGQASLQLTTTATAGQGATTTTFNSTPTNQAYTVSFYAEVTSGALTSANLRVQINGTINDACTAGVTLNAAGFQRVICAVPAPGATVTSLSIQQSDATARTFYIDAVQMVAGTSATPATTGAIQLRGAVDSPAVFQSLSNSTTAFQIQNTAGTSNLFVADTLNSRIGIGTNTPAYPLDVVGDINSSTGLRVAGTTVCTSVGCTPASGSTYYIQNGTTVQATSNFNISGTGTANTFQAAGLDSPVGLTNLYIGSNNTTGIFLSQNTYLSNGKSLGVRTTAPTEALTVNGNINVRDADTPTKQIRIRTSGTGVDVESGGGNIVFSTWTNANLSGTQRTKIVLENTTDNTQLIRQIQFRDSSYGTLRHTIDGTVGNDTKFNQDSEATNFIVQGQTDVNLLYIQGSTNRIGIGTATPGQKLDVQGGNINTSGSIMTGGTARIDASGNLAAANITSTGTYNSNAFTSSTLTFGATSAATVSSANNQNLTLQAPGTGTLNLNAGSGTINATGNLNVSGTIQQGNAYPVYKFTTPGAADLNWKTIANVNVGAGAYGGVSFEVDVVDSNSNLGAFANQVPIKYFASALRSAGTADDSDIGSVSGPIADYVQVVKTSNATYELQVRQTTAYHIVNFTAQVTSLYNSTVNYVNTPATGSTGTTYSATLQHTDLFTNASVNGNLNVAGASSFTGAIDAGSGIGSTYNSLRTYENLYSTSNGTGAVTGTFELALPTNAQSTMLSYTINGYDYTGKTWQATVGGFLAANVWYATSAQINGSAPFTSIRLGYDTNLARPVLLLGGTTTSWYFPQISVTQLIAGYATVGAWGTGYGSQYLTSETVLTNVVAPAVQQTANVSQVFLQGGNTFGTTAVLGTNDANNVSIKTNNVTQFIIDTSGNAGLTGLITVNGTGTSSIAGTLNVNGAGGSVFAGSLQAATLNATTTLLTNGTQRIDASGNLSNIGNITSTGNYITTGGTATVKTTSTTALSIQNASAVSIFNVDTSTGNITLGSGTGNVSINNAVNVAAGKSITINGGNTSSRPASPTKGMLYYDTTTNQLIQYNGSKWVSAPKQVTEIVAANNSSQQDKDSADFVGNGTTDQTAINSAVAALPASGGSIVLLAGTFTTTAPITLPSNVTLTGQGNLTTIVPTAASGAAIANADTTNGNIISVSNLTINGSANTNTIQGISVADSATGAPVLTVSNVTIKTGTGGTDIQVTGKTYGVNISNSTFNNSYTSGTTYPSGIAQVGGSNLSVVGSTFNNAAVSFTGANNRVAVTVQNNSFTQNSGYGVTDISVISNTATYAPSVKVTNNQVIGGGISVSTSGANATITNALISANTITNTTTAFGIATVSVTYSTISDNNLSGAYIFDNSGVSNIYSGNTVTGTLSYTAAIYLFTSNNETVSGNNVGGTGSLQNNHDILVVAGNNNDIVGNTSVGASDFGIGVYGGSYNKITGNHISGAAYEGVALAANSSANVNANTVSDNTILNVGSTGILLVQIASTGVVTNSIVTGNTITNPNTGNNSGYGGIRVSNGSTGGIFTNNTISSSNSSNAIVFLAAADTNNTIGSNFYSGSASPYIVDNGTANIYMNQQLSATSGPITRNSANSTTAFQIQNAAGTSILNVDTSTSSVNTYGTLKVRSQSISNVATLGTLTGGLYVTNNDTSYGLQGGVQSNGDSWLQAGRTDGTATAYNLLLQPAGGKVGIGTTSPAALLSVGNSSQFQVDGSGNVTMTGIATVKTTSTTALSIQNAGAVSMFNVDTSTGAITMGNATNGVIFTPAGGLVATGTAQHTKNILLTPEFAGAVLDASSDAACTSANNGTLTSAYDSTSRMNNYNWTSGVATAQCYDVVVQVPIPSDFSSWSGTPDIEMKKDSTGTGAYALQIIPSSGNDANYGSGSTYVTPATLTTSWSDVATSILSGTYTPGDYMTIKIRMSSTSNANVKLGNIKLTYNSKY